VQKADDYRRRAAKCLSEAESAPAHLRLTLLTIAQKWRELADLVESEARDRNEDEAESANPAVPTTPSPDGSG
jgi:hypothetical protein